MSGLRSLPEKWCAHCGKKMGVEKIHEGFNIDTGNQMFHLLFKCPDYKWYNRHTLLRTDEDGEVYDY